MSRVVFNSSPTTLYSCETYNECSEYTVNAENVCYDVNEICPLEAGNGSDIMACGVSLKSPNSLCKVINLHTEKHFVPEKNFGNVDGEYMNAKVELEVKVVVWNIHGLRDKLENEDMCVNLVQYDIVILLETMKLNDYFVSIKGFTFKHFQRQHQHPRAKKASGGIGILIKTELLKNGMVSIVKSSDFVVWLKIRQSRKSKHYIFLGGVYIPPADSSFTLNSVNNNIYHLLQDDITSFAKTGSVTLCGDFNARTGKKNDIDCIQGKDFDLLMQCSNNFQTNGFPCWNRYSEDIKVNNYGKELLSMCKSSDLKIMNGYFNNDQNTGVFTCYTPCGKSLIDYLVCDLSSFNCLKQFSILPLSPDSDHKPLVFSFKICNDASSSDLSSQNRKEGVMNLGRYQFDLEKIVPYRNDLKSLTSQLYIEEIHSGVVFNHSVDEVVESLYSLLHNAISVNFCFIRQKSSNNTFPRNKWFDDDCKQLKKTINIFLKNDNLRTVASQNMYQEMRKTYRQMTQRKKRQFQENLRQELDLQNIQGQVQFWKNWKSLSKQFKQNSVDETITLEDFDVYFESVKNPPDNAFMHFDVDIIEEVKIALHNHANDSDCGMNFVTDYPICFSEVSYQLKCLKSGKAPGIDGIGNEFYKYAADELIEPLTVLFNYVWEKRQYPDSWSEGIIQPLHKKGPTNQADNYRKITLMASMGKIFEAILNQRLAFHSEAYQLEDSCQFGFSKNSSTSDNLFIIDTLVSYQRFRKKPLFISFIDFTKAFDFINRDFLYYKLANMGIGSHMLDLIKNMFFKARSRVRWQGRLGKQVDSVYGVLQGGIISPKLFNLFLADIHEYLDIECGIKANNFSVTHLAYADDLVLISETAENMQKQLFNLQKYCRKWHLMINANKSKVMIFNRGNVSVKPFTLENNQLEIVKSFKYLGHVISQSCNIHSLMFEHVATKAQQAMHVLNNNIKATVGYMSPMLSIKMFDTYILPILEYNSEIWLTGKEIVDLEKIQLKFLKNILNVRQQTTTVAVLAEFGKFPLHVRQKIAAIKYWYKLQKTDRSSILYNCYELQIELYIKKCKCWLSLIAKTVEQLELPGEFLDTPKALNISGLTEHIYNKEINKIFRDISDESKNPKLRTYKLFKNECRIEPYLMLKLPKSIQKVISRFRLSSHNLKIETGRHRRPYIPPESRICDKCNLNLVEDEFHCLMICPKWNNVRKILVDILVKQINSYLVLSQKEQFIQILSNKTYLVNKALGEYLKVTLE
jgi:exonuclease III